MEYSWFELTPSPDDRPDDQNAFLKRARRAAGELGLSDRPAFGDLRGLSRNGCVVVARGGRRWLAVDAERGRRAADALAHAAMSTATPCERPGFLDERLTVAHAFVPISATLSRTARDDETDDSDVRLNAPDDGWVAFNIRRIGLVESGRNDDWLADEFNRQADTSKLRGEGVGVCRVVAAASDARTAREHARLAANALGLGLAPGFAAHVDHPRAGLAGAAAALAAFAFALYLTVGCPLAVPAASLLLLAAALVRLARTPADAALMQRPRHRWWLRRRRRARSADRKTILGGDERGPSDGRINAYAFQRSTMPLPAGALAGVAVPSDTVQATTAGRDAAPTLLLDADGPLIGRDLTGRDAHLAAAALYGGVGILGEPGSGKSNLMHGLEHWEAARSRIGDAMVVFESKGADSLPILERLIPGLLTVDVCDPATPMVDLLGAGDAMERAGRFADLMRRALGDTQVGPQSRIQIRDAVFLALECMDEPDLARQCAARGAAAPATWPAFASTLLAADGVGAARRLASACVAARDSAETTAAVERLHGGVSASGRPAIADGQLMQRLSAPMNKMDLLARADGLCAKGRPTVSWRAVVSRGATLAVNIGPARRTGPDGSHAGMDEGVRRLVGALLFQSLRDEVEASCAAWQDEGRACRIFVDEMTDVSGDDGADGAGSASLRWLRERGRAYGVRLYLGTQNPGQMPAGLLNSFLGLMTLCCFTLRAPAMAQTVGEAMDANGRRIGSLAVHDLMVRTVDTNLAPLPAFVATVPHFDAGDGIA